jgi:hypothetical protein
VIVLRQDEDGDASFGKLLGEGWEAMGDGTYRFVGGGEPDVDLDPGLRQPPDEDRHPRRLLKRIRPDGQ